MPIIDGLVTGIETTKLIDGLLSVKKQSITSLQVNQAGFAEKRALFQTVAAQLVSLQLDASALGRSQNSAFDARTVTSSNKELATGTASSIATTGSYSLRVNSLARAHQIASQGFDAATSLITQGAVQIRAGTSAIKTITIDGTNNTLQGLADAINNAGAGVTAAVINDGSGSRTQPFRLLINATKTGADNAITITNSLAASAGTAIKPLFDAAVVGPAATGSINTGTSTATANSGVGVYTGTTNNVYRFTVTNGGTVGSTDGILVAYTDTTGTNTGTITINSGDTDVFKAVAQGIQVKFAAGTLVNGDSFTIDAFVPTVQAATNASVALGSGAGALIVESATNRVESVIPGVTIDLTGADPTRDITLTVAADIDGAKKAITSFVDTFNGLMEFIDEQIRFESQSGKAGPLLGDRSIIAIQDDIRKAVLDVVAGANPRANNLAAVGVTVDFDGRLEINASRLDGALSGQLNGVTLADIRRLFAFSGLSTNPGVQVVTGSVRTKASAAPYQVDLSQAAEQAVITATTALAASTFIDGSNNTLSLTIDGRDSGTITIAPGTYTRLALAQELESLIEADGELAGRQITVGLNGDKLVFTSPTYGFVSEVTAGAGTAWATLGFAGNETDKGQDVVGKFIVAGVDEPAVGNGQFLSGNTGNANTADLQVRVTLTGTQIVAGPEADLTVTRGVASRLDILLSSFLDPVNGRTTAIDDRFEQSIETLEKEIARQNTIMEAQRQTLVRRFAAMEVAVSRLRAAGDTLTNALLNIRGLTTS